MLYTGQGLGGSLISIFDFGEFSVFSFPYFPCNVNANPIFRVTIPAFGELHRQYYSQSESPLFQALGRLVKPGPSLVEGLTMSLVKR